MDYKKGRLNAIYAGYFGQLVTLATQIVSLPIMLTVWDPKKVGLWFVISAIPTYFTLADFGMTSTAGNELTFQVAQSKAKEAISTFQKMLGLSSAITSLVVSISATTLFILTFCGLVPVEQCLTMILLIGTVLAAQIGSTFESLLRATSRIDQSLWVSGLARLLEWSGLIGGLIVFRNYLGAASGAFTLRFGALLLTALLAKSGMGREFSLVPDYRFAGSFKKLLPASLGGFAYTISSAMSLQGTIMLVAAFLGPAAVTTFTAYRTIARSAVQFSSTASHAKWADFSIHFASLRPHDFHETARQAQKTNFAVFAFISLAVLCSGKFVFQYWTNDKILFSIPLILAFLLYGFTSSISITPRTAIFASNQQAALGTKLVVVGVFSFGLVAIVGGVFHDLTLVVLSLCIGELVVYAYCRKCYLETLLALVAYERTKGGASE